MDSIGTELQIVTDSAAKDRSGRDRHGSSVLVISIS